MSDNAENNNFHPQILTVRWGSLNPTKIIWKGNHLIYTSNEFLEYEKEIERLATKQGLTYSQFWERNTEEATRITKCIKENQGITVQPLNAEWKHFWQMLDELQIWEWLPDYNDLRKSKYYGVVDGYSWHLHLRYSGKEIISRGSNAYPPDGSTRVTDMFRQFGDEVSHLVGGRRFFYGSAIRGR